MNTFWKNFRLTTFWESHWVALWAVIDWCPAWLELSVEDIQKELDRRKPWANKISSQRKEWDKAEILSWVFEWKTLGTPIAVIVRNEDNRSNDYENIKNLYRPGHADEAWDLKFWFRDYRWWWRSSGRETLSRVIWWAIAKKFISLSWVEIYAEVVSVGDVENRDKGKGKNEKEQGIVSKEIEDLIIKTKQEWDSLWWMIRLHICNCPVWFWEPVFNKFQALIAHALFSIGTVRSIELTPWKSMTKMKWSESNKINSWIAWWITNWWEIIFEIWIKPTPSIGIPQDMKVKNSVIPDLIGNLSPLKKSWWFLLSQEWQIKKDVIITGRHDPCIAPRAVPVIESMWALVVADLILERRMNVI